MTREREILKEQDWRLIHILVTWSVVSIALAIGLSEIYPTPNDASWTWITQLTPLELTLRVIVGFGAIPIMWFWKRMAGDYLRQRLSRTEDTMGLLTFSINVTLDGCVDHQEGIADDETHAFFTRLMDEGGAMLWGRVTYEMMESYWPAVARGDAEAPPAMREWAVKLEAKPKYVVSSTRKDFPWTNSHHIAGDLRTGVQKLKDATPAGVLLGSGKLATELDRLDLIDEYKLLVHPRIAGHGPTLYESGLPSTRRLELVSVKPFRSGAVAMHYRRAR